MYFHKNETSQLIVQESLSDCSQKKCLLVTTCIYANCLERMMTSRNMLVRDIQFALSVVV